MIEEAPKGVRSRIAHAWNAFTNKDATYRPSFQDLGQSSSFRQTHFRFSVGQEKSITESIYNRLSIDVAALDYRHVRNDEDGVYETDMESYLQDCFTWEANIDQAPREFFQDVARSIFDHGVIAICPTETTLNPNLTGGYDILNMRIGPITTFYPKHVLVNLYDEADGQRKDVLFPKRNVAIVTNPLYAVMNEGNSTLNRLKNKLALLDAVDEQVSSGKLDIIIQLPYEIRSDARREQAKLRRQEIEEQLRDSQYGIAYTGAAERIHQLNRAAENHLWQQVQDLTKMLYSELGLTPQVFDGTAEEAEMLNYHNRTIEPIASAIVQAMRRSFLTKTARRQRQSIQFYRDPFKLVPVGTIAEIADKFTRNEIASANEIRTRALGWRPHKDPKADELRNSNLSAPKEETAAQPVPEGEQAPETSKTPEGTDKAKVQQLLDRVIKKGVNQNET